MRTYILVTVMVTTVHLLPRPISAQIPPQALLAGAGYPLKPYPSKHTTARQIPSIIAEIKRIALDRERNLPNFFCDMTVSREKLIRSNRKFRWKKTASSILVRARYVDGIEDYQTLKIGRRRSSKNFFHIGKGLRAGGEFGGLLSGLKHMTFQWSGRHVMGLNYVQLFVAELPKAFGSTIQRQGFAGGKVGWRGVVCAEESSNEVLAVVLNGVDIPWSFGIHNSTLSVIYSIVDLDGSLYYLPKKSIAISDLIGDSVYRQVSEYNNYRKFHAESDLFFEDVKSNVSYPK